MENVILNFEEVSIPFNYTSKISPTFYNKIKEHINKKVIIITDDRVKTLHINKLIENLDLNKSNSLVLSSPPGEQFKSIETISSYIKAITEWGIDRSCLIICFGGGIPGNVGGLVSGLMYRGINFIHIPTTIMSAFDSVISLKQAVNSNHAKNALGIYHKPVAIYSSAEFFYTLEYKEVRSGLCETVKNVLTILPSAIQTLSNKINAALDLQEEAISLVKDISITAKQKVMRHDKLEKKNALILEYGHTLGHAIELIDSKKHANSIPHGEAVGLGMLIEAEISYQMGCLSQKDLDTHYDILSKINIDPKLPSGITIEEVIEFTKNDNKRGYISADENHVGIILLKELGCVNGDEQLPITAVPIAIIKNVLKKFIHSNFSITGK